MPSGATTMVSRNGTSGGETDNSIRANFSLKSRKQCYRESGTYIQTTMTAVHQDELRRMPLLHVHLFLERIYLQQDLHS